MTALWHTDPPQIRYVSCSRCGLSLTLKSGWPAMKHCPRCVANHHTLVEISNSPAPLIAGAAGAAARVARPEG